MNYRALIAEARENVASAQYSPKKLVLIHSGVIAAVTLVLTALSYLLDRGIGSTGGLSGIGMRSALETAQTVLSLANSVLLPFWTIGFLSAVLLYARRQTPLPPTLLSGLRHWWAVLRLLLLQSLIYVAAIMIAMQLGSFLYVLSPSSESLMALLEQSSAADTQALTQAINQLDYDTLMGLLLGMLPFLVIPILVVIIPLSYRLRYCQYVLMDTPQYGVLYALLQGLRVTKKNCMTLLKLDLRFWWFYLLNILCYLLCLGDVLLAMFGISLDADVLTLTLVFYALGTACQIGLHMWQKPQVMTAYALLYDRLTPPLPVPEEAAQPEEYTAE